MTVEDIADMEPRLELEQILARAVLGEFTRVDVHGNDALSAVELGVNMVLELEIEKVKQANSELDEKVRERTRELCERLLAVFVAVAAAPCDGRRPPVYRCARCIHRLAATLASSAGEDAAGSALGRGCAVRCRHLHPARRLLAAPERALPLPRRSPTKRSPTSWSTS